MEVIMLLYCCYYIGGDIYLWAIMLVNRESFPLIVSYTCVHRRV